ncbi:MAG: LamG-like jellyroll fold domain-containing protein, partial [Candidatus Ratteibacteria bacterium]
EEYTFNLSEGSISFWMKYGDENVGRTFFNIGYGWKNILSLTEYPKNVLNFYAFGGSYTEKLPEPNVWHFVVISWKNDKFFLYIDGIKKCEVNAKEKINKEVFKEHLFILPGNSESGVFGPKTHINGIIDELYIFKKSIEKEEIEFLMKEEKPIIEIPEILCKYEYFFNVLPRDKEDSQLKVSIINSTKEIKKMDIIIKLKGIEGTLFEKNLNLKGNEKKEIIFNIPTYKLVPGEYELNFEIKENGRIYSSNFPVKIGLWKNEDKLPILAWNAGEKNFEEMKLVKNLGVNTIPFSRLSYKTYNWANEIGVSLFSHMYCIGDAREGYNEDRILKNDGELDGVNPLSEYVINSTKNKAIEWVNSIKDFKELKYIIVNTEWQLPMDFGDRFKKITFEKFGIDLSKWETDKTKAWRYLNPYNRLAPGALGERWFPENGLVKKDDNFYNFHFWYHEGKTNEIAINEICLEEIKKERSDIKTIIEPILRYPPKKKYSENLDIAEEWFYYENPRYAIWIQENLNSLVRGKNTKISGMPQFLFKAHAQPFAITPPPDLFKEATLLCISRPLDMLTFWGWHNVLEKTKNMFTIEEMEDKTKNYDIDNSKWTKEQLEEIKKGGENGLGFVYVPETKDAFREISLNYFIPFGKLFRKWENYPRKVAVLNSFASWIYSDVRWPSYGYLGDALLSSGIPFDILWDEDFTNNPDILNKYDIFIMPQIYTITEETYEAIKKFVEKKGIVIVDDVFKIKGIEKNLYVFQKDETEKIKSFIRENVKLPVKIVGDDILMNILSFKTGNYIFLINDKRVFGRYLGRWQKIKEKGVDNEVTLIINKNWGQFLYDLNSKKVIFGKENGNVIEYEISLKGAEGKILYVSNKRFKDMKIFVEKEKINKGEVQKLNVLLNGEKGFMEGGIPVLVEILEPDNRVFDISDFYICEDGKLELSFYLPINSKEGEWKVKVKEFFTDKEKLISFFVR